MNEQENNPFRPPRQLDARTKRSSIIYVLACLLWCGLAIKVTVFRPTVRSIVLSLFEEFDRPLPTLTLWLLHPLQTAFFLASAAVVLSLGVVANTSEGRGIGYVALLIAIVAIAVIVLGVGLPLLSMITEIS